MDELLSDATEAYLKMLDEEYWLEIANLEIRANRPSRFASATEARLAMLREAYRHALNSVITPKPDFNADVEKVLAVNEAARK